MSKPKPKIAIIDTYYQQFLTRLEWPKNNTYEQNLEWLLSKCFGTFDAYSRGLTALGWNAIDIIGNSRHLQVPWCHERGLMDSGYPLEPITLTQLIHFKPDVVFMQDLSYFHLSYFQGYGPKGKRDFILAGQCSCAWPGDHVVERFDILFTSFPHYVERFEKLGVKAVFLPLAFDPEVHHRLTATGVQQGGRDTSVSFAGGLSKQFGERDNTLRYVQSKIPGTHFTGYGGALTPLWGLDMYKLYGQSKIVLNIHHPAAEGYSNNLRMFEATGMGALLLTELSPNIQDYFTPDECVTYTTPEEAVDKIRWLLANPGELDRIAQAGQCKTLTSHTYFNRMPIVARELEALIA